MGHRILIKGTTCAGKSTLGYVLAQRLALPRIELDELHWGPNWTEASAVELQGRVRSVLDDEQGWVVEGNYDSKLGTLLLDRADLVVWLDLPLGTKLFRLARRTARRVFRREQLWHGNRETLRNALWGRGSLLSWMLITHFRHRRLWPARFASRRLVRLRSSREVDAWLAGFRAP